MDDLNFSRIEKAIRFLAENADRQPSLETVAAQVGLSHFHFQRLFKRWAGVSPKKFLQYLTVDYAKQLLRDSGSLLDTAYQVGLSGPGRLHDLFVSVEAVTPGEFKTFGRGLEMRYGFLATPFGECLVAETERGICNLEFVGQNDRHKAKDLLQQAWRGAALIEDGNACQATISRIFSPFTERHPAPISIFLKGTNFQIKVWEALLRIPEGSVVSYANLADMVGHPGSNRAVGNAVAKNPLAYLIPCHRVLRSTGEMGGYRWGLPRKRVILAMEMARTACAGAGAGPGE
jgi:AraC family transcriptional regulator of adaptative response/methylated-DNA-[protein]-cysteine methyltransferase